MQGRNAGLAASDQVEEPAPSRPTLLARFRDRDHTRGSLVASLAVLSLPSLLTSVVAFGLFQLIDLRFLGLLGPAAVAAAGATNQTLRQFLFLFVIGVTVSCQMLIARSVGAGSVDAAEQVAGQTLLLGVAFAGICAILGLFFAEPLVALVVRDPAVVPLAVVYAQITMVTMFTMIFGQLGGAVLSGAGDTTTPMLISLLMTPVSIVAEWALAFGHLGLPALGITGIVLGAALGGAFGVGVTFWALWSGRCRVHIRRRHLVPDVRALRSILSFAWQPSFHMVARTSMVFFFMWLAGLLGGSAQAAYTIGLRIEMLAVMIAFTVANACATLVSQNLGAGLERRSRRSIWVSYGVETALLWPVSAVTFLFRTELVQLFTTDAAVVAMASEFLMYSAFVMLFYGLYFVSFRTLQAAGDMRTPMLISVCCALFVGAPLGYTLAMHTDLGATGMWIANTVYAGLNCALNVGYLLTGRWARRIPDPGR